MRKTTTMRPPSAAAAYSAIKDQLVSLSLEIEVRVKGGLDTAIDRNKRFHRAQQYEYEYDVVQ